MKFNLTRQDKLDLEKLIETKNINMSIADMLLECSRYECITDPNYLRESVSLKDTYLEELCDFLELDMENEENISLVNSYIKPGLEILNVNEYINNPYNKSIRANGQTKGNYSLNVEHYSPYQLFASDEIEVLENDYYHEISKVGLFEKRFNFLSLLEKDTIWMCITPNEMNTMNKAVESAHGNVVTFGLGLGYFAYMASEKENVNKVTIIERDRKVIDLFMFYIYPQFKNKDKIQIVYTDAFEYLKLPDMNNFDYAFIDLWHNPEDGLPIYMKFKKHEDQFNFKFDYWLEKSLIAMFRRCLITVLEEQYYGYKQDKDYLIYENELDQIINKIYKEYKNKEFTTYKEINELCKDDPIIQIIKKL